MRRAAFSQPGGYQTGRSRPAAPQASPGTSSTGASMSAAAMASPARSVVRPRSPASGPRSPVPGPPPPVPGLPSPVAGAPSVAGARSSVAGPSGLTAADVRGPAAQDASRPAPSASASASGAMNCWPSRNTANPGQKLLSARSRSRPGAVTPRLASTSPATAAVPSPGQRRRRSPNTPYPAPAASARASQKIDDQPPYPAGTACAFHIPPSISRLPREPNGVSARAANAATPAGSAYTGRSRDGISHGRLPTASTPSAAAPARTRCRAGCRVPAGLARIAAGSTTSAEIVIAAKPPAIAGSSARPRRPAPRQDATGPVVTARSAHGRP